MDELSLFQLFVLRKKEDRRKELMAKWHDYSRIEDALSLFDEVVELVDEYKKDHTSEWDQRVWIATYEDIALAYREIHEIEDDRDFTDDEREVVLEIARNAEKNLEPYDWNYQVKVFVEESERWMNEQ